ncbi:MAG: ABC transporter ATP-binding protein [Syntrophomonadaceae bacterium]|nr:ABC transporter ATP-binding protein [Syntrophomonadaceae bacterium]
MAEIMLQGQGLIKEYGQPIPSRVLHGIDIDINTGEFLALVGRSGSGKSTLLNIIGALDRPTAGKVIIDGTDLYSLGEDELAYFRNQTLGFIFQFHFLLPQFTVFENVLIPYLIYHGRAGSPVVKQAEELLERVGLAHRRDNRANAISGGEQQRAAVARALINQPRLVLADEPTGNLDSKSGENVFALMREINRDLHTTFIMVTHDSLLANRTDRIVELRDGLVLCDQSPVIIE